jgi:DNA-binding transcriptional LysR family regulator
MFTATPLKKWHSLGGHSIDGKSATEAIKLHNQVASVEQLGQKSEPMTELDANDLLIFARVADTGSFSRAAERMRLPKSTVSRRVAALEKRLGERLVHRSTRKLTITNFGMSLLDHARALATEVDGALALAQHRQAKPSGRLRVSLPSDLATIALPSMLTSFVREHPAIVLELDLSPRRVDLIGDNFDLAVRMGEPREDSQLSARKLAAMAGGLYAAPAYLKKMGEPLQPEELLDLHGLLLLSPAGEAREWVLEGGSGGTGTPWHGKPHHYTMANSPAVLMRMAEAGFGVVSLPDFIVREAVERGGLRRVLPAWALPMASCWAIFPGRRLMPTRTRAFLDALVAVMSLGIGTSLKK